MFSELSLLREDTVRRTPNVVYNDTSIHVLTSHLLAERPYADLKSKSEMKAKRYYMSCIDLNETMEALGGQPMLDLLKKVGGWNVTTANWTATASNWSLQTTLHQLHNGLNMGGLFSWSIGEDDRNSSRNVIQVGNKSTFAENILEARQ